jgi:hypothetical protein
MNASSMGHGGVLLLGQKVPSRPQEENIYIYTQLVSFLPIQFSNNPLFALPFFFFFFHSLPPSLPSLLLSCKPLEKGRVHVKGTEEEMIGNMSSIFFGFFII